VSVAYQEYVCCVGFAKNKHPNGQLRDFAEWGSDRASRSGQPIFWKMEWFGARIADLKIQSLKVRKVRAVRAQALSWGWPGTRHEKDDGDARLGAYPDRMMMMMRPEDGLIDRLVFHC
jgi:hypothetical protein